jgi:hypothetical protein
VELLSDLLKGGEAAHEIRRILQADAAGSNVATAQPVLPGAANINVKAATTYEIEVIANMTRAAGTTSHTTGFLFGGTATITAFNGIASASNPTGNILAAASEIQDRAAASTIFTAANAVATEEIRLWVKGILVTLAAGTLIPQFIYSVAPGGPPTVKRGSYIRMRELGPATVTTIGG